MDELNFSIAHQVGAFERGVAKDIVSRNIKKGSKNTGMMLNY